MCPGSWHHFWNASQQKQAEQCCHGPGAGTGHQQLLAKPLYSSCLPSHKQDAGLFLEQLSKQVLLYIQINTAHALFFVTAAKKNLKSYLNSAQQPPGAHGHIWNAQNQVEHGESNKTQPAPARSSSHLNTQGDELQRPLSMKWEPLQALRKRRQLQN